MTITSEARSAVLSNRMGSEFSRLFFELDTDCDWLQHKWLEFNELYGCGAERVDLLNRAASNFFYLVNQVLFESLMMHLSRLTDPPKSMGNDTLTIRRLADLIGDTSLKDRVEKLASKALEDCQFARTWRNKRLAHSDLKAVRKELNAPLPAVAGQNVKTALDSLRAVLVAIEEHCGLTPTGFAGDPWGAKALVSHLKRATQAIDAEDATWDAQIEADARSGKLDRLAEASLHHHAASKSTEF